MIVLIFGTKKLRNTGRDLGEAVRGFKEGVKGEEDKTKALQDGKTIDSAQKDKSHSV